MMKVLWADERGDISLAKAWSSGVEFELLSTPHTLDVRLRSLPPLSKGTMTFSKLGSSVLAMMSSISCFSISIPLSMPSR